MDFSDDCFLDTAPIIPRMDLWPNCPWRPVDWRWARAIEVVQGVDRFRARDDKLVRRAHRFLRAEKTSDDQEIVDAVAIFQGEPRRRWELEARVLARQTDTEISDRLGVPVAIVAVYVGLFFSVREKLKASDWIMANVVGPKIYEGCTEDDTDVIWRFAAYWGGPHVLDVLLARHDQKRGMDVVLDPAMARRCDLFVTVHCLRVDDDSAPVLRLYVSLLELEVAEARSFVVSARPIVIDPTRVVIDRETPVEPHVEQPGSARSAGPDHAIPDPFRARAAG